ncbi:hypothetical protein J6590_002470 [Homalodisca vitripennis]|nr:hypothetical protein J6590_002470 [Homalodisca vitripennis]
MVYLTVSPDQIEPTFMANFGVVKHCGRELMCEEPGRATAAPLSPADNPYNEYATHTTRLRYSYAPPAFYWAAVTQKLASCA